MINRTTADIYRKIFIFATIPFGLCTGIATGLWAGLETGLIAGVVGGLIYGFFMSLILGAMQQFYTRLLKTDYSENLLGVHQVQAVTLDQPFDDAYATCQFTLEELAKCKITQQDKELGIIRAEITATWKSFGENILLTVSPDGTDLSKVTISSKPTVTTTIVDYGKNAENMRAIIELLQKRATIVELSIGPVVSDDS